MKVLLPLSLVAVLATAPAFADCPVPTASFTVPDGATATMDAMLAAKHAVKDYDTAIRAFTDCLKAEQDAKVAAGGDKLTEEDRQKISIEYANRQNTEVEKLQQLADQFNVAVRAYKARTAAAAPAAK